MALGDEALWRDHLEQARWFQGKGLPFHGMSVEPLEWYCADGAYGDDDDEVRSAGQPPLGQVWVRSELATVEAGGSASVYHLLVGYCPPGTGEPDALVGQVDLPGRGLTDVVDVPRSPLAMRVLLTSLAGRESGDFEPNPPDSRPAMTWFETPPDPDCPTKVFEGEQSNTTVLVGDSVLFKIFRKLSPGPNLESEVMTALSSCPIIPRLIGVLSAPEENVDLGIFCQRIPDARDGWAYAIEACQQGVSVSDEMQRLGETLRGLHASLAEVFPTSEIDSENISAGMLDRLDTACAQLPELRGHRNDLRSILTLPASTIPIQRLHGDFHLGQALISPSGWTIIDFEGEPLKSPEERCAPDSVWRDVAGLLRSLDYARSTHPYPESFEAWEWYENARAGFLRGYSSGTLPTTLLTAYEVDKAVYELVYEVRNRPTWAGIPRRAILSAISRREN